MLPASPHSRDADCTAIRYHAWGNVDVLGIERVPRPAAGSRDIVIRTRATALNPKDILIRKGRFRRLSGPPPIIPGFDICGDVVAIGDQVDPRVKGQRVFAMLGGMRGGAMSEFVCLPAERAAPVPVGIDDAAAAATPLAALTALQALRDLGRIRRGKSVVINGAAGGVGTFAVQIAALLGAQVTALCSERNFELCRSLGAHRTLDYRAPGILQDVESDVYFDVYGNQSLARARRWLATDGTYITTVPSAGSLLMHAATGLSLGRRSRLVVVHHDSKDLAWIVERLRDQTLRPVVERSYPFSEVAEAFRHLESRHARGKLVLTFPNAGNGSEPEATA